MMTPEKESRLKEIYDRNGVLTAQAVLEDAQNPTSPLHEEFEWDDDRAAQAHRLLQARTLIRSVKLVITTNKKSIVAPYYVRDAAMPNSVQGYVPTISLKDDKFKSIALIRREVDRIEGSLQRLVKIADVLDIADEIVDVTNRVTAIKQRLAV